MDVIIALATPQLILCALLTFLADKEARAIIGDLRGAFAQTVWTADYIKEVLHCCYIHKIIIFFISLEFYIFIYDVLLRLM